MTALLALDTATERMSLALARDGQAWTHEAAGGATASATLIPAVQGLLARAGLLLRDLDAIAFGRGPGAFTGLRTACSVAQGLALGANKPVLPVDTLLALAEDARDDAQDIDLWSLMDARMDEIYAAHYAYADGAWRVVEAPMLVRPEALNARWRAQPPQIVAGNAVRAYGARLDLRAARRIPEAMPHAAAMLRIAGALWERGGAVDAAAALPLYVRDKVAQTTAERAALRTAPGGAP
ncbi:MAG: tRNA (adenosine(37)-N6)-threonylcarbamoyltransferase complex dimerization subunit type 1 TsaB [Proteobacteria bacterium]|nr:tRNA (adenosine(37)-N6)-threonylcarbamoyltransferase complex dimerization subunit type 1 TsaB [Pseudomonadota bacterium]